MRVALTPEHLATQAGKELLDIAVRITLDGKLDADEIKSLYRCCVAHKAVEGIPAIPYLLDIIRRIAADKRVDRDELMELHLAIERVVPTHFRSGVKGARKAEESARRERDREAKRLLREQEKAKRKEQRERDAAENKERRERIQHIITKVAGVSFPNDDGSERQDIIGTCDRGEPLELEHDPTNRFSCNAIKVLRETGEQLGHVPEHWAADVCALMEDGWIVSGVILNVTGGTWDKEYRGVNIAVVYTKPTVTRGEYDVYVAELLKRP